MTWLLLLFMGSGSFTAAQTGTSQLSALQTSALQPRTVEVVLELIPDEGLLVNRLNPPEVSLLSPWRTSPLPGAVSGKPWAEHPGVYFERVNPVAWTLKVPAGTPSGQYRVAVTAKLGLCKKDDGFCFIRGASQTVALNVTRQADADTQPAKITLRFHAPSF